MTYFEIAKRKKHFHNTNIHWHLPTFHLCNYPAPKTHPYPPALGSSAGPLRERPPKCWWSPPESGDCVLKCQWNSLIGWQNNVWYSNSSVLVIWFSLGPCSRVLSDVLHVVSPKSTNCISFRRVQSVQSTCPPWWGNSQDFQTWTWQIQKTEIHGFLILSKMSCLQFTQNANCIEVTRKDV